MKSDVLSLLLSKGYRLIDGQWFAPGRVAPAAQHQPNPANEPVAAHAGKVADSVRRIVRVESYRCKLVDRDAVWVKYIIDALRYAGILWDDTTQWLEIETHQIKVAERRHERTEITIT